MSQNPFTRFYFDVLGVPQPKNTFGELLKLCILIDRKMLLKQPYSKVQNVIFWNQKLITKCITKSAKNVIRNLDRSRKALQNTQGFIIYLGTDKNFNWKWLNSIPRWGVCRSNLFEPYNILTIKSPIKNFSLDDPNDFKLTQKKDIDRINHIEKFGKNLSLWRHN